MKTKEKDTFPCYFGKPVQDKLRSYILAELDCIDTRVAIIRGIVKGDDAMYLHSIRVETKEGAVMFEDVQRNIDRYLHRCRNRFSKPKDPAND